MILSMTSGISHAKNPCPQGYHLLPSWRVCIPMKFNLGRVDALTTECVMNKLSDMQTDNAVDLLAQLCASAVISHRDWRD